MYFIFQESHFLCNMSGKRSNPVKNLIYSVQLVAKDFLLMLLSKIEINNNNDNNNNKLSLYLAQIQVYFAFIWN